MTATTAVARHLKQAKIYFNEGEKCNEQAHDKYRRAADEILRAIELNSKLTFRKIAKVLNVNHSTVSRLVKWRESGARRTTPWETQEIKVARAIQQGIREQPEKVVEEVLRSREITYQIISSFHKRGGDPDAPRELKPYEPKRPQSDARIVLHPFDVVQLGRHVLVCGDSEVVRTALSGATICASSEGVRVELGAVTKDTPRLLITDPPYGIGYKGFRDTKAEWKKVWENFRGDHGFVFYEPTKADQVISGLRAAGFEVKKGLTWIKGTSPERFRNYGIRREDESLYRVERKGVGDHWVRDKRLVSPLWSFLSAKERADSEGHTTPKPVDLLERLIKSASREGDIVIDPFAGGGSTILAAEKTRRRCLAIELEPKWCDVAVRRWQRLTGKSALVSQSPRPPIPFDDLARHPELYNPGAARRFESRVLRRLDGDLPNVQEERARLTEFLGRQRELTEL